MSNTYTEMIIDLNETLEISQPIAKVKDYPSVVRMRGRNLKPVASYYSLLTTYSPWDSIVY